MAEPQAQPSPLTEYDSDPLTPLSEKELGLQIFPEPLNVNHSHHVGEEAEIEYSSGRRSRRRSRHILSRDFIAHVLGDRTSPSRDPLYCLDPVKFSPPEKSGEHLDPCKRSPTYANDHGRKSREFKNMLPGMSSSFSAPDFQSKTHLLESHYSMNTGAPSPARVRFSTEEDDESPERSPKTPLHRRDRPLLRAGSPTKLTFEEIMEEMTEEYAKASSAKRSRSPVKQLFGEGGFLGRSISYKEAPEDRYRKKGVKHGIDKIRQTLWNKTEDLSKLFPPAFTRRDSPTKDRNAKRHSTFDISLNPEDQCRIYAEMELMICAVANHYLMTQMKEGRMSVESVAKVTAFWQSKNRPQVVEFHFDQQTQCELIFLNIKTFRFYGSRAENPVALNAMMLAWKTMAREMSVRTFCSPDSMIKKQLHDLYRVLEMLGAPGVTFVACQQVQRYALNVMKEKAGERKEYESMEFGVEKKWEPEAGKMIPDEANPFL